MRLFAAISTGHETIFFPFYYESAMGFSHFSKENLKKNIKLGLGALNACLVTISKSFLTRF